MACKKLKLSALSPLLHTTLPPALRALVITVFVALPALAGALQPTSGFHHPSEPPVSVPGARTGEQAQQISLRMLTDVLAGLERDYGVAIVLDPEAAVADRAVADPAGLPPEAALMQALQGFDFFIHYGPGEETGIPELKKVWVFPPGRGNAMQVTAEPGPSFPVMESQDPQERAAAIHRLVEDEDIDPQDTVTQSLADEDENVRLQALVAVQDNGLSLATEALEYLLSSDPSEAVRILALEAVSMSPDIDPNWMRAILGQAAGDASPEVRERAVEMLRQLDAPVPLSAGSSTDSGP